MDTIINKMQGILDELVRAPAVTNPDKIVAAKAAYTQRMAAVLAGPDTTVTARESVSLAPQGRVVKEPVKKMGRPPKKT